MAIGIDLEGRKEVLGLGTSSNEGAKFWLGVLTEPRNPGVKDILIACVDGLKGFPQAIETGFPEARVQWCIVHLVRASLNYVNWKERKFVAADWKAVYRRAPGCQGTGWVRCHVGAASIGRLQTVAGKLGSPQPFFDFPAEVRKMIYTTNAVESACGKSSRPADRFRAKRRPSKLLYLALRNASAQWGAIQHWKQALNQFEVLWGDRVRVATGRS